MDDNIYLVRQAQAGNVSAFSKLYESVYKDMYRFALYTLKNTHDAEDAVSDTVTDAFASIARLRDSEKFKAWIFKILANKCKKQLKVYANREEALPEETTDRSRDLAEDSLIRAAFFLLSEEERLIVALHLFGGYTSTEIGDLYSMQAGTVRSKQSRALAKMRQYLEGDV